MKKNYINIGKNVIDLEIKGLKKLKKISIHLLITQLKQ